MLEGKQMKFYLLHGIEITVASTRYNDDPCVVVTVKTKKQSLPLSETYIPIPREEGDQDE